jgi:hypothetical protein
MQFGLYLHRKGVITADQLVAAIEVQTRSLVRIGQLALEECILSARDIFDILRAQHDSPHEPFGELAIHLGLMTRVELMRLLMIQADRRVPLGDILVRQGVLTQQRADEELTIYRLVQRRSRHADRLSTVLPAPHQRRLPVRITDVTALSI